MRGEALRWLPSTMKPRRHHDLHDMILVIPELNRHFILHAPSLPMFKATTMCKATLMNKA